MNRHLRFVGNNAGIGTILERILVHRDSDFRWQPEESEGAFPDAVKRGGLHLRKESRDNG